MKCDISLDHAERGRLLVPSDLDCTNVFLVLRMIILIMQGGLIRLTESLVN